MARILIYLLITSFIQFFHFLYERKQNHLTKTLQTKTCVDCGGNVIQEPENFDF